MSSPSIDGLRENIRRIQLRRVRLLRLREISLGMAFLAAMFAALVCLEMIFQFPPGGRMVMTGSLAAASGAIVWRYIRFNRQAGRDEQRIAHYVDEHIPELEQRLITSIEYGRKQPPEEASAVVERLWEDTLVRLRDLDMTRVSTVGGTRAAVAAALILFCGLFYAVRHFNGFTPAGLRIIKPWTQPHKAAALPVGLNVEPGTIKIQRGNDVLFIARIANAIPDRVDVYLRADTADWTRVPMKREGAANSYVHFLPAVQKDVEYYVHAGVKRSDRHRISVIDVPRVEQVEVDYVYPEYTGMKTRTVKDSGDVIAPEGTRITLHAGFNKAVAEAAVLFSDGARLELTAASPGRTTASGSFVVTKDMTYTIKVIDLEGVPNEDPYEYFVRSVPDAPPAVTLIRPGGDRWVMSLEEVSIAATAEDDYGLAGFAMNYMVAGGKQQKVDFLAPQNERPPVSIQGRTTLYLEDLDVNPGDVVMYYLTAQDNKPLLNPPETVSDIYFLEVVPTQEAFRRAPQQGGAGGGSGGRGRSASALVENQKNIIAATWKLLRQQKKISPTSFEAHLSTITESQRQVLQRTQLSLRRLSERLSFSDDSYQRAVEFLVQAVVQMEAAIQKLTSRQLAEALRPEQAALQAIMKAESESRNTMIQVARSRGGGGGSGGQSRERQDLTELFEMEMGRLENRYEMPRRAGGSQPGREQDDTLEKLRALARRQERLNRGQNDLERRQDRMTAEQRKRRLEELRREQEALRREAQELANQMSRLAQRNGWRQWSDRQRRLEDATRLMQEAEHHLRQQDADAALTRSRQAVESLQDQERELRLDRQATVSNLIDALRRKGQALQRQEEQVVKMLPALQADWDSESAPADPQLLRKMKAVLAAKDQMKEDLAEAEAMLKAIGTKGRTDQSDIADRALQTLRALKAERVKARIAESQQMLEAGWLGLSMDAEQKIEQSIEQFSQRLRQLDRGATPSRDEQIRQAAVDAEGLRRELESLQTEIAALKQSRARQQPNGQIKRVPGNDGKTLEQMRQRLQRSRRYARGLVQPWTRGEGWGNNARSIQRELTQREIQDYLSQPELWQNVLEPVRELESTLRAEATGSQLKKKVFAMPEDTVPAPYRDLVEEYYRELSQIDTTTSRP